MKRIIIGITGASGVIFGIKILEALKGKVESHLIITKHAKELITLETSYNINQVSSLGNYVYDNDRLTAPIASGTFKTEGMIILPCSIKTLSAIANSFCDSLLIRAADVTLKEKRKLVLGVRETPFHFGHLELMMKISEIGGIIFPPLPAFYFKPQTIDDIINHIVGKILDLFQIDYKYLKRWEGINI